ncbi:MAG: preprotein translocase subunit YajC [Planctomycetes bacterium]|nr:preprotein translocase subunit YajC [Planctomycetota bacterium]
MPSFDFQLAFEDAAPGSGIVGMLAPMAIMFAIFYFLLIRPQQKQRKKEAEMREALKVGDEVVTQAGIIGSIKKVTEQHFVLELEEGSMKISKAAVVQVIESSKS